MLASNTRTTTLLTLHRNNPATSPDDACNVSENRDRTDDKGDRKSIAMCDSHFLFLLYSENDDERGGEE